jgi:hypothetical protein
VAAERGEAAVGIELHAAVRELASLPGPHGGAAYAAQGAEDEGDHQDGGAHG